MVKSGETEDFQLFMHTHLSLNYARPNDEDGVCHLALTLRLERCAFYERGSLKGEIERREKFRR